MTIKRNTSTMPEVTVIGTPKYLKSITESAIRRRCIAQGVEERIVIIRWSSEWLDDEARSADCWTSLAVALESQCRLLVLLTEASELGRHNERFKGSPDLVLKCILADAPSSEAGTVKQLLWSEVRGETWMGLLKKNLYLWEPTKDSRTQRLCRVCQNLPKRLSEICGSGEKRNGDLTEADLNEGCLLPRDLFAFLHNPIGYQTKELHGVRASSAVNDGALCPEERVWAKKTSLLKFLAARLQLGESTRLNILVVENTPDGLRKWHEHLEATTKKFGFSGGAFSFLEGANWYLLEDHFASVTSESSRMSLQGKWKEGTFPDGGEKTVRIPWDEIDLVLQDIMLGGDTNRFTGLDLTPHYLQACPQALVFLMTGMDVESLVASSGIDWRHVDAVIPKRRLEVLWWEYYQCFRRRFGRMFWNDWVGVPNHGVIGNRKRMRNLFGSLRKWQLEPSILGHGQGVPEMIDHAERHISCLWRNVDDYVSELIENGLGGSEALSLENRMLLTMGTWLHDIGHRGDEYMQEPMAVRSFHAGISEYLLLRNPDAYGLGWIKKACVPASCRDTGCLALRNQFSDEWENVCLLRKVGLLCRHHQSNAPLSAASLEKIIARGKEASPYSRVRIPDDNDDGSTPDDLSEWLDDRLPLSGWQGSRIVSLQDFVKDAEHPFLQVAGILRMLDGMQLHRRRVGSSASIESFKEFLATRDKWAMREIERIDHLLESSAQGTPGYLRAVGERTRLEQYRRLVRVQFIHYWRQMAVHDLRIRLITASGGDRSIELGFVLDEAGLVQLEEMKPEVALMDRGKYKLKPFKLLDHVVQPNHEEILKKNSNLKDRLADLPDTDPAHVPKRLIEYWATHVFDDMIRSEHNSQEFEKDEEKRHYYLLPLDSRASFRVSMLGLSTMRFKQPLIIFESGK